MDNIVLISISEEKLNSIISNAVSKAIERINKNKDPLSKYPDLLTRSQVAKILGVAMNTIDAWSRGDSPRLKKVYIGNAARFKKTDIQELLKVR